MERVGSSATRRKLDETEWRSWAYEAAKAQGAGQAVVPAIVRIIPYCKDWRGVSPQDSAWRVVEPILDGLVSAGVITSRADVLEVTVRRPTIGGRSVLEVELIDAAEPF